MWPVLVGVGAAGGRHGRRHRRAVAGRRADRDRPARTRARSTTYGLPFVRAAGEIAAVWRSGSFLFAAFLVPPQPNGVLDAGGYRALRLGTVASAVWTVCAALLVPLTVSDVSGQPLREQLNPVEHLVGRPAWSTRRARGAGPRSSRRSSRWRSIPVLRWSWTPVLFAGSLVTLLPLALTGHSSAGGSHDLATNSLLIHLIAGRAVGGRPAGAAGPRDASAASTPTWPRGGSRRSRCGASSRWRVSGVVNALVRIQLPDLFRTDYGWLVIAKVVALCVLGVHRLAPAAQRGRRADDRSGGPRAADPAGADRGGGLRR